MKILTGSSNCSNRSSLLLFLILFPFLQTQGQSSQEDLFFREVFVLGQDAAASDTTLNGNDYPDPESVLYKSLILPGWGQVVNGQTWKVPVIYALLGGLGWYSVYLTQRYHDYRAAYYNATDDTGDLRFGPTPDYISPASNPESLRSTRNLLRNRRDFTYIAIGLAYGLNVLDAYVYAHMRTFDVSEDLSLRTDVRPVVLADHFVPGVSLSIELFNRSQP